MKVPDPKQAHNDDLDFFGRDKNIPRQKPAAAKRDGYVPSAVAQKEMAER